MKLILRFKLVRWVKTILFGHKNGPITSILSALIYKSTEETEIKQWHGINSCWDTILWQQEFLIEKRILV